MNFKRGKISSTLRVVIPIFIIGILFSMISQTARHVKDTRDYYVQAFVNIIKISIENSHDTSLSDTSKEIITYLNTDSNRITLIYIYDDDLKSLVQSSEMEINSPFDFNGRDSDIKERVLSVEEGMIPKKIDMETKDIYFKWIRSEVIENDLLIIYSINQNILTTPHIYIYAYIIMALIFAYGLMVNITDRGIYMKVLQRSQKDSIDSLAAYMKSRR